jgi:c-di-GMP-binding flagellar brake protein YcgR
MERFPEKTGGDAADASAHPDSLADTTAILFRSRIEIGGILEALAREGSTLSAELQNGQRPFLTRVLHVDPQREFFVVAYSEDKAANLRLLEQPAVDLRGVHQGARIEFSAARPADTVFGGRAGIMLEFPVVLVRWQRRHHPRYEAPPEASLRCVADTAGFAPFEARISDISLGGLGTIVCDADIRLPAGSVLRECRIVVPQKEAVVSDLEVRYTRPEVLPDGTRLNRSGVRFLRKTEELEALIRVFMVKPEQTANGLAERDT